KRSRKKPKGKKRSRRWRRKYLPLKPKSIQRKVRSDISKNLSTISKQNWKRPRKDSQNLKNYSDMKKTTVIIGKQGSGKSRLAKQMAEETVHAVTISARSYGDEFYNYPF